MAKIRNHKAEYARSVQLARERGYSGQRQSKTVSRVSRNVVAKPLTAEQRERKNQQQRTKRVSGKRVLAQEWSDKHSKKEVSRYDPDMSDKQAVAYYNGYVKNWGEPRSNSPLNDYLDEYMSDEDSPEHDGPYYKV